MENNIEQPEKGGAWFLFSLQGRISRKPYWIFMLIVTFGAVLLGSFKGATINMKEVNESQILYLLLMAWPSVAVLTKRWHDRKKSALWVLILLIPVAGPIWTLLEAGFLPGTSGPNEYGPDPLATPENEKKGQTASLK